jgi:hypothetical protein
MNRPTYLIELNSRCEPVVARLDGKRDGLCGSWPTRKGKSGLQQVRLALRRAEYVELIPAFSLPVACLGDYGGGGGC